jgi:hypothetical protein
MPTRGSSCGGKRKLAVVTLSIGTRPFATYTRPLMEAYARKVGADFHYVDSTSHAALSSNDALSAAGSTRFQKLPLLSHFLRSYGRVLYLDDDTLVSPATPNLFSAVPCDALGAVVERHKPQNWHAMHWRSACELYGVSARACRPSASLLFNSGVMLLTRTVHAPMLRAWRGENLTCRVLCDQLYLNALLRREGGRLHDLREPFNYVGSELRRAITAQPGGGAGADDASLGRRRSSLRAACVLHLTRKVPKLYTADWTIHRALGRRADVLQCAANASWPSEPGWRDALLHRLPRLPRGKYAIGEEMCRGQPPNCALQKWAAPDSGRH